MEDYQNNLQAKIFSLEVKIKRIQLITAFILLITALSPVILFWVDSNGTKKIIELLKEKEKPFEGIWSYNSNYEIWLDEKKPKELMADGKTIIIWKENAKKYEVYISFKITRSMHHEPLLALSLNGFFDDVKSDGRNKLPKFTMDNFKAIARLAYKKDYGPPAPSYQFTDCKVNRISENEESVNSFECILITKYSDDPDSIRSRSKVTFSRKDSLH
ncbi:hypothetical protein [Nitrosomonas sp.]|uniref:hypothetical protein n=1 Tax=Nitrosomonas sp. TaxID=42353 RepID=UPI0025D8BED1|nr:hypothetical protein [Nitrosomonas sp.]